MNSLLERQISEILGDAGPAPAPPGPLSDEQIDRLLTALDAERERLGPARGICWASVCGLFIEALALWALVCALRWGMGVWR
jgi:hypothetical protein